MSMQGVENIKDALISIIKSIRQEMKVGIIKRQLKASTASESDEVSSIASKKVDRADDNTLNTAPCRLPKELSPGNFLLPFNIDNHSFYAITTLDAKDNIMPLKVYEYLEFKQGTKTSGTPNPQDEIAEPIGFSPDRRGLVKRWHDEALPLGRVNGARFKAMIRKELEGNKCVYENPEAKRQLSRLDGLIIML
ncbi:hypothetical protein Tco_0308537 [Tanacetum coccineum]